MCRLSLLVLFVAGCAHSVASPPPVSPEKKPAILAPASEKIEETPKPSIVYGAPLGAVPSGWTITIAGGPTYVLTNPQVIRIPHPTRTPPFSLEYSWSHVAGPTAFSVYVDENNRMRLTGNEFSRAETWMAVGPMASWSNVDCRGAWTGHTLDLDPL